MKIVNFAIDLDFQQENADQHETRPVKYRDMVQHTLDELVHVERRPVRNA